MDGQLDVCRRVASAVEVMYSTSCSQAQRLEAYNECERFKTDSSPGVIECSLFLASSPQISGLNSPNNIVQHFGLKTTEEFIKLRWNNFVPEQKLKLKESVINLVKESSPSNTSKHITDGKSRLLVEIAKREWPQQWPTFLAELDQLANLGLAQTHVVVLVFLRLIEDVAVLQSLEQTQRRKEIHHALMAQMDKLFLFLQSLLNTHCNQYVSFSQTCDTTEKREALECHQSIIRSLLQTFSALCDFVAVSYVMYSSPPSSLLSNSDCKKELHLIKYLIHILSDERHHIHVKLDASDCLLSIARWKAGKEQDRIHILKLFDNEIMQSLFEVISSTMTSIDRNQQSSYSFQVYSVLKNMSQMLMELGSQLLHLWPILPPQDGGKSCNETLHHIFKEFNFPPSNFNVFIDAILVFSQHDSLYLNSIANDIFVKFLKHKEAFKYIDQSIAGRWCTSALEKSVLIPYSTDGEDSKSSVTSHRRTMFFASEDFDAESDYKLFHTRMLIVIKDGMRQISSERMFGIYFIFNPLSQHLHQLITTSSIDKDMNKNFKNISAKLEAVVTGLDAILGPTTGDIIGLSRVFKNLKENPILLQTGVDLVKHVLSYPQMVTRNAVNEGGCSPPVRVAYILSNWLSCLRALFPIIIVSYNSRQKPENQSQFEDLLVPAIKEILSLVHYIPFKSNCELSKDVLTLRRHGSALMVKLATRFGEYLLPIFEHLYVEISNLRANSSISNAEYCTLVESLVLICNQVKNFDSQAVFLARLASDVLQPLTSKIQSGVRDVNTFVRFIGLHESPADRSIAFASCDEEKRSEYYSLPSDRPQNAAACKQAELNRIDLSRYMHFLLAFSRRSAFPQKVCEETGGVVTDIDACRSGSFLVSESPSGSSYLRNPVWKAVFSVQGVLETCFSLIRVLSQLWAPNVATSLFHKDFSTTVLEITECERNNIFDSGNRGDEGTRARGEASTDDSVFSKASKIAGLKRMRTFIFETFENNFHLINQLCSGCGVEFYKSPLASSSINSANNGVSPPELPMMISSYLCPVDANQLLTFLPDFRLRPLNKSLKTVVNKCPEGQFHTLILPMCRVYIPYMITRLNDRWKRVNEINSEIIINTTGGNKCQSSNSQFNGIYDDDEADTRTNEEVLEDMCCRCLTREFLDTLKALLTSGEGSSLNVSIGFTKDSTSSENLTMKLSKLGVCVREDKFVFEQLIRVVIQAISWSDSQTVIRASHLLELVLPDAQNTMLSDCDASHIVFSVLKGIQVMGRHETSYISLTQLLLFAYDLLRPKHASIVNILYQIPGVNQDDISKFDTHILRSNSTLNPSGACGGKFEKTKKDMLRKILSPFIERDVAEKFKYDIVIKNLPQFSSNPTKNLQKVKNKSAFDEIENHQTANGNGHGVVNSTNNGGGIGLATLFAT